MKLLNVRFLNRVVFYLTLSLVVLSLTDSVMAQGAGQLNVTDALESTTANYWFANLFKAIQNFAGILLVIGVVIAGLLWMANKPQFAIGVLIGSAVVFGGPYLVGLINGGLGSGVTGGVGY